MKALLLIRRKNVWGYSFKGISYKVIKKDVPILSRGRVITKDLPILQSTRISKSGYTTRNGALKAGQKRYYDYYNKVTYNNLTAEQRQDIAKGLYSLQELNRYINYMISSKAAYNAK